MEVILSLRFADHDADLMITVRQMNEIFDSQLKSHRH
jgi:hypothetical protein